MALSRKRTGRGRRSVFVVARPLTIAGPFSFLSGGKVPLCHWGLLLTDLSPSVLRLQWETFIETQNPSKLEPWGTLFELCRLPGNRITHHMIENFTVKDWLASWGAISLVDVGETRVSNSALAREGMYRQSVH